MKQEDSDKEAQFNVAVPLYFDDVWHLAAFSVAAPIKPVLQNARAFGNSARH